jgi:hypothetical protein
MGIREGPQGAVRQAPPPPKSSVKVRIFVIELRPEIRTLEWEGEPPDSTFLAFKPDSVILFGAWIGEKEHR